MYETRVKAQATDNLQSPWSSAFYITRAVKQMSAPKNVRLSP
jgi:hypothetical protein